MSFKVQVGPPQVAIHQGQTVLISEQDGQINWPSEKGLYFFDTRVVSSWRIYANGEPWELLNGGAISFYASRIFLTNRSLLTEDGTIPPRTLGFTVSRSIAGGMHEDLDITNNCMNPVRFQLEIALRCDFADVFEVKSGHIVRRGRITTEWSESHQHLRNTYRNADFSRTVTISPMQSPTRAVYANGRLSFEVALEPGEDWHCCLLYALANGDRHFAPPRKCIGRSHKSPRAETIADWLKKVVKIQTSNEEFYRLFRQALEDMAALRLPIAGTDHMVFLPAAGLPWFFSPIRTRQPDRLTAEHPCLSGVCARSIGDPRRPSGEGGRRLPRRRARQDNARDALRGACAFQADPAHALLRHRGCDAALLDHVALGVARNRRPGPLGAASRGGRRVPLLDRQLWRP